MINIDYIKNLFNFKFPECCSEWNDLNDLNDLNKPNCSETINEYGSLLKSFTNISNNYEEQINYVVKINSILEIHLDISQIENHINTFNKLKKERKELIKQSSNSYFSWYSKLTPVPTLSVDNDEVWGSKRQYLFGKVCSDLMKENNIDLPPFFCSALHPTGGICGAGNQNLYTGKVDDPITIHSCIHDASGYCYNYHKFGIGYNYLNSWFALPTYMPISCQMMGIWTCWSVKQTYISNQ